MMILSVALPVPVPKTFDYLSLEENVDPVALIGRRVKVPFGPRTLTGLVVAAQPTSITPIERLKKIVALTDAEPLLPPSLLELGKWLSHRTVCSLGEALDALLPPGTGKYKPAPDSTDGDTVEFHPAVSFVERGFSLTHDQAAAVEKIHEAIYSDQPHPTFLVRGVSAAGKTEVYLSAIKDTLDKGRSALFLVPEIGLATFLGQILMSRFGEKNVCLWHSEVSLKNRRENWWKIKRGEFPIVIGARSAALLPVNHLGLIVVDEEHDSAWKEDRKPRFHVRNVVLKRARLENSAVIFGSATPSLEILKEAFDGRVTQIELSERAVQAAAPSIRLIDRKSEKGRGIFSHSLEKAIGERLQKKEQVILFLNRRGFHRYLICPSCDWVARCEKCGVTLVEHKSRKKDKEIFLMCHYCQTHSPKPAQCPSCNNKKIFSGGTGTERVMEEIQEKFPWAQAARWDRDSVKTQEAQEKILADFKSGSLDILVGTQLVAQGFHFPNVTLVGVVDADSSLYLPDFRAAERTFQLITQVAGRAGRELVTGEVLIQTRHPDHNALVKAASLDVIGFSKEELRFREDLNYPPFSHLIQIETHAKDEAKAAAEIEKFITWINDLNFISPVGILGPTKSKKKLKGIRQQEVLLKILTSIFKDFLNALNQFYQENSSRYRIDVDI